MNIPVSIAEKLILLQGGEKIPASKLKHIIIDTMLDNGILEHMLQGRSKKLVFLRNTDRLVDYLSNHFGISNLHDYVSVQKQESLLRSDLVAIASDSKHKTIRTFKGFLVNCYLPINATLNNEQLILNPTAGCFQFIYDFENFTIPADITIVGVENSENFRYIEKQRYLFQDIKPLFVSRYPQNQSKDLIKWLQSIPNNYLHFGDFDFAGVGIYLNEFKKHLGERAKFLIPSNIEELIMNYGSRKRYDSQKLNLDVNFKDDKILGLINIFHIYKKGLDQEIFIKT